VCDRCTRDGLLLQVAPIDSDLEAFVIVRCERHAAALAAESAGAELPPRRRGAGKGSSPAQDELLALVTAEPGLHPTEYGAQLGKTNGATSHLGTALMRRGLLRVEGQRGAARYYPA